MRLTVRYPVHFGADPPTCDRHKDAILSYPHIVDVPEISRLEADVVFDVTCGNRATAGQIRKPLETLAIRDLVSVIS